MNHPENNFLAVGRFSRKRFWPPLVLALLCVLVTGCPHNDYTIELKPKGAVIERTLTFYRADGGSTNAPDFPSNQLAAITRLYPAGALKPNQQRYVVTGEFAGALPNDVGGAGAYTNFTTSLGATAFYAERFRGDDDLAAKTARQFRAADQLTDLVIGWTRTEFGRGRDYSICPPSAAHLAWRIAPMLRRSSHPVRAPGSRRGQ